MTKEEINEKKAKVYDMLQSYCFPNFNFVEQEQEEEDLITFLKVRYNYMIGVLWTARELIPEFDEDIEKSLGIE